ncbi:cupin domain-containing protein [Streptomyces sp. NP160]|uniref:cupin domain-containing protein n=1 Tax=Streptomyces sp. NP160 TaxID=2586637 RepID=UPI0015D57E57|nr:cupin domain-containing protein [Streptomyces sp. NP160]
MAGGVPEVLSVPGEQYEVRLVEPGSGSSGRLVSEWSVASFAGPPPHRHPAMTESWEVLAGRMRVTLDGVTTEIGPGERASAAPGVVHSFEKAGGGVLSWRQTNEPPLQHELLYRLEVRRALRRGATGQPGPLLLARMLAASDAVFVGPPVAAQRVLVALGRWLNRRDGTTAHLAA